MALWFCACKEGSQGAGGLPGAMEEAMPMDWLQGSG